MTGKIAEKIDTTLFELMIGTLPFGLLCQVIGVFFVENKLSYSLGLWIGILTAMGMAYHMWWTLNRALGAEEKAATQYLTRTNLLRYAVVAVILGVVMVTGFANPIATFLGIMGLKVSAYLQPFTHKCFTRRR